VRVALSLLALAAVIGLAVAVSRHPRSPATPGIDEAPLPPEGYVGSRACGECHSDLYARWKKTAHASTLQDFAPGVSKKPFDGEVFTARDIDHKLGPGAEMWCEGPGGEQDTFPVEIVIGVRRIQMFTTTLPGGRIQVLPVFLEVPKKRWFDYTDFIFGAPPDLEVPKDSQNSWYSSIARNFNSSCGDCHTTNYEIGYDPDKGTYQSTWSERTVGCESCHGPGAVHTEKWRRKDGDSPETMASPGKLSIERSNQICGMCHAEAELVVPGFLPGDDLFAFKDVHGFEDRKHVRVDGRANELIHNLVPIMQSRCGPISCTKCHDPHGRGIVGDLYQPIGNDWTCTQCHGEIGANIEAHTHHKASGKGSRCVNCHMQRMIIEGGHGWTHDHTISIPSVSNTKRHASPNACQGCHLLETPVWQAERFKEWWPGADKRNHRVALADTMAGGDKAALKELLADSNEVYRAGAAWALADHGVDLRPQLADKHPMVRRAAIKGVGKLHPEALLPLLEDANMVLRRRAAETLARNYALLRRRPELIERVRTVLEAFVKLRPDDSGLHASIGYMHEFKGRKAEAIRSYERSLRVNPHNDTLKERLKKLRQ